MGYCTNCGASNASGNSFCWKCGGPLAAENGAGEAPAGNMEARQIVEERPRVEPVRPQPSGYVAQPAQVYRQPKAPTNGLSTAGMILGIVSLALFLLPYITIVTSVIGLIFSVRSRAMRYRFSAGGLAMNIIGLVLAVIFLAVFVAACSSDPYFNWYYYYY